MIRWGVIGAGGFANARAIPGLKQGKNLRLQAVMVRDLDRAQALADRHGATEAHDSVESLLESPDVDAVYVCTPVDLHREHTEAAAAAGKHVLCEKPMAMDTEDCLAMIRACQQGGVLNEVAPGGKENEGPGADIDVSGIGVWGTVGKQGRVLIPVGGG